MLPDLPLDVYESDYQDLIKRFDLDIIFLITPQTDEGRIRKTDELSTGFVYMVSSSSITGTKTGISPTQINYFERIQAMELQNPQLIGFGISNNQSFSTACQYANGAIIGSAFIKALVKGNNIEETCSDFVNFVLNPAPSVK